MPWQSETYVKPAELTDDWANRLTNVANIVAQFHANGRQQPVQLVGLPFRDQKDPTIGQILHVPGDGQPRCYPLSRVAKTNALDPSPIVNLAPFAMLFRCHWSPVIQNLQYSAGKHQIPGVAPDSSHVAFSDHHDTPH